MVCNMSWHVGYRDDLPNGGAEAFAGCITEIKRRMPATSVEVLIPDFKGSEVALQLVMAAQPDILNHNLETAERLYRLARPGGRYDRALRVLANARAMDAGALTKSGIIWDMARSGTRLSPACATCVAATSTSHSRSVPAAV